VVIAEPGQEIRVVVPSNAGDFSSGYGDSRVSPSRPTDSRVSPSRPADSRVSPGRRRDVKGSDPLGFGRDPEPAYSPRPVTIVAQPGQEIRVIVPEGTDAIGGYPGDSRVSPPPSRDSRVSPPPSRDAL
jgi:hypothetical protein